MKILTITKRLEISGVVQGVGFRPFLFGLAKKYRIMGEVSNTAEGVRVVIQGSERDITAFIRDIDHESPLLASVTRIRAFDISSEDFSGFRIVKSTASSHRNTLISPDVSICPDCLSEMRDPENPRYEYPFINCTNCGPRYTIIEDVPYDRPKTSMKAFEMCESCRKEYEDPLDRRFHAQPNACPACGPLLFVTDKKGKRICSGAKEAVSLVARHLNRGKIVAVKGLGGFHLACDAANYNAVMQLRKLKRRPDKPFALMARTVSDLADHVHVSKAEQVLLESYHRPIVLLKKKRTATPEDGGQGPVNAVAPHTKNFGVMLPYTPLHYLLLEKGPPILVMTSGNRSGEPLSVENEDALKAFSHIAALFLMHNRDIYFRADDSIARVQAGRTRFLRRSRGYAPLPLFVKKEMPKILGCGAGMKSTICLTRDHSIFVSQHIGDLENQKVYDYYQDSIRHFKRIFDIEPDIIAHDLHPGYMSTDFAGSGGNRKRIAVQHHHAHAAACMAEHDLEEEVIAVTLDGTGYGTDGTIWGGEVLLCTPGEFERKARLSCLMMPGGDAAVLEPWRMAASLLYKVFGKAFMELDIPYMEEMEKEKISFLVRMMEKNVNSPLTSSAGRLFDAVASLLCVRHRISFESQAAMELEAVASDSVLDNIYGFGLIPGKSSGGEDLFEIDYIPCIRGIVTDLSQGRPTAGISAKFHHTLVAAFTAAAVRVGRETGLKKIVLSGGVFNNDIVLNRMIRALGEAKFEVYSHSRIPTGDGGICVGQAVVAAARSEQR